MRFTASSLRRRRLVPLRGGFLPQGSPGRIGAGGALTRESRAAPSGHLASSAAMRLRVLAVGAITLMLGCGEARDVASARGVALKRIGTFSEPVYVTSPPGDRHRVFVVERGGRIRVVVDGRKLARPFLDISDRVSSGGERGLLSMAFAPDYRTSGRFYVDYTDRNGDSRIVEYRRASTERADPASARQLIFQRQPEPNHNGGLLLFGPDGRLYVGFGDGGGAGDLHGSRGNAQNLGTLLGKILRIDPLPSGGRPYGIPADNPFAGRAGARGEIWAYGLRNPWRFSFTPAGAMVIGDVGQDAVEEIDVVRQAGANLGWRVFEGRSRYAPGETAPGALPPALQRFHSAGNCSITGGLVVRDARVGALLGRYVFGDFCTGRIESARVRGGGLHNVRSTGLRVNALSSFGQDARGRAYAVSLSGPVYRFVPRG
jgi:Glucose / Sorbosone dehydrogenase